MDEWEKRASPQLRCLSHEAEAEPSGPPTREALDTWKLTSPQWPTSPGKPGRRCSTRLAKRSTRSPRRSAPAAAGFRASGQQATSYTATAARRAKQKRQRLVLLATCETEVIGHAEPAFVLARVRTAVPLS